MTDRTSRVTTSTTVTTATEARSRLRRSLSFRDGLLLDSRINLETIRFLTLAIMLAACASSGA
jgi:hypothetical protein